MRFSVIVASYNDHEALGHMLLSLAHQSCGDFEVIVADDGSTDGSVLTVQDFLKSAERNYQLKVAVQKHAGWRLAAVRNLGATLAEGEFLIFVDGDQFCDRDLLLRYSECLSGPCAVAGVRHYVLNQRSETTLTMLDSPLITSKDRRIDQHKISDGSLPAFQVWGCNCGVSYSIWDQLGGFDESFRGWGCEETDFFTRVERGGFPIFGCPGAIVYHLPEKRAKPVPTGRRFWREVKRFDNTIVRNGGAHLKHLKQVGEALWERLE